MNYYFKIIIAAILAAIITGGLFLWVINLIGIIDIFKTEGFLDEGYNRDYEEFNQKYNKVVILKDDEFKNCGVKTVSTIIDDYQTYFVIETTGPLMAKFVYKYWSVIYDKTVKDELNFNILSGKSVYHTFERGRLLISKGKNISDKIIVGTKVDRRKIVKMQYGLESKGNLLFKDIYL